MGRQERLKRLAKCWNNLILYSKINPMLPEGPLFHKPSSIIAAINILYATLFLAVVNWAISQWSTDVHPTSTAETVIILLVTLGLIFSLIKMIGLGKKWARVVLLVLFVLGILPFFWMLGALFKSNLLVGVLSVFQALLQAVALVFLFSQASTQWFNHVHSFTQNEA
jgi:hypothetical protein